MKGAEKDAENLRHKQHMAKRVRTLAAELAQANKQIDAMKSACKGYSDTVLRVADARDAAFREQDALRARIEALHADLRTRTEERDAAQTEARKYAETRRLADDLQAELAAAKVALAEMTEESQQWANNARDAVFDAGVTRGQLESLAALTLKNGSAAVCLAEIIAKAKPCAP